MNGSVIRIVIVLLGLSISIALAGCGGSSCKDACTAGAMNCESNTLMTCGDFDGNGCTEWGDPFTCPDQCLVDRCESTCQDQCPVGTRRCSGNDFQVCSDSNGDGCTEWGNPQTCGPGRVCTGDGQCTDECVDSCTDGASRCVAGGTAFEDCVCPQDDCCDWGPATDCPQDQACTGGACVACQHDCSPAGARQCVGNDAYQVCGETDTDPCNEWGAATNCEVGEVCVNGSCTPPCSDDCTGTGTRECTADNRGFRTCGNYDTDPCLEFGDAKQCAPSEVCDQGVCTFNCTDECATGEKRCLGSGYQTCANSDADPCTEWSVVVDCKHNETCSNGVCAVSCADECSLGDQECSGFQSWRECGEFDHDGCADWGEPHPCNLWERCLDVTGPAECVIICFNDCDTMGVQQCAGDGYQSCGDHDWDACLEWSDVIECGQGELCSNGECSSEPCEDDTGCTSEGLRECYLDVGFRVCGYFDSDNCLDWSAVTECGAGKVCQNGDCVDACSDACQAGTTGCVDNDTRWVCNDADGDGCLDQVNLDCDTGAGESCSAGVCSASCTDDNFEPNDTWETSYPLQGEGIQAGLKVCSEDDDWYDVFVGANDSLAVTITFVHANGDLDLELYDANDPTTVIAFSAGIADTESVVMPASGGAQYLIRVYGYAGATNDYDLSIDFVGGGECLDDWLEENDDQTGAQFTLDGDYAGLKICAGDEDWFRNYMFDGEDLVVDLSFLHASGDIDLQVLDDLGNVLASSETTGDAENVSLPITVAGTYFVRVYGFDVNVENDYDMTIAYSTQQCSDDLYEENDHWYDAVALSPGTYNTLAICSNDEDWFSVDLSEGDSMLASISFTNTDGDLDLYLEDYFGMVIDYSTTTGDIETVGGEFLPAGTYFIRVEGWNGAENLYDLDILTY